MAWLEAEEEEGTDLSEQICAEKGCDNAPESGFIYCVIHLYGTPNLACPAAREWKHRQAMLKA